MARSRKTPKAGNPTTKPGKHGTLYLYRITYKDKDDAGAPEFTMDKWGYSLEHIDDITQDWAEDGWKILSVARVPANGGSMHRAIKHRTSEAPRSNKGIRGIMKRDVERNQAEYKRYLIDAVYNKTHPDYRANVDGKKAVLINGPRGATLTPLEGMKTFELERMLHSDVGVREAPRGRPGRVDDYIAVDRRGRRTAGPFKSYSDARTAAGTADHVQFVPAGRRTSEARRMRDGDSDESEGEQYADDQLQSDYFRDWIVEQMADGAKLAPEARIPLETPADFKRLARRMLQDLEFDTRRQHQGSKEFFEGMRRRLNDKSTIEWLAEELQHINERR